VHPIQNPQLSIRFKGFEKVHYWITRSHGKGSHEEHHFGNTTIVDYESNLPIEIQNVLQPGSYEIPFEILTSDQLPGTVSVTGRKYESTVAYNVIFKLSCG